MGVQWHKILYAWRIQRGNFRGAAAILLERLQRVKGGRDADKRLTGAGNGGFETKVTTAYLALINCLSCVDGKQAWILDEGPVGGRRGSSGAERGFAVSASERGLGGAERSVNGGAEEKRKVVTLTELRAELGAELDRLAAIENDQFAVMDVDMDMDGDDGGDEGDIMDVS